VVSPVVVVHGGAGRRGAAGAAGDAEVHAALTTALAAARAALERGGPALDAAQAAVESLEACPRLNAGTGSVLTADGEAEMDAALMDGVTGRAGAVAAARSPRHPIAAARAVLERSPHVLLAGPAADAFAAAQGVETVPAGHHVTRREQARSGPPSPGTVGAVVLDVSGGLAAATSTGGMRGQLAGRVGDSPLIGAGTYADATCAVSASGHGEALIGAVAAYDLAARLRYGGAGLADAATAVIAGIATDAALIAVDREGRVALPFNTEVFNRGWQVGEGAPVTAIVSDGGELRW